MSSPFTALSQARYTVLRFPQRIVLPLLIGTLALATTVFAAETPLTLAEAQRLAVERSRQLASQDFAVSASREMAVAAGQLPDPVLKLGVDNLPVNGPDRFSLTSDFMTMRRVGVMQELTRADKRRFRSERYEREAEKSLAEKSMTIASIQRDTALAWLDLYYAQAAAAVIAEQGAQARLEVQAAEGAYRAGRGSQADVFAARSGLALFDDRASEIQRRVANAKTMLARWIGQAAEMPLAGKPAMDAIRVDPSMLDTQLAHHPQIAVLSKQEEIAAAEAKLAQANKKADWNVEVAYQQRGPAFSNMISVGVSIPLQWDQKNRQDRELASKLALVEQAKAEREDMVRAYMAETRSMINEWQNGRERRTRYEKELIPLANERTLAAIAAYRGGKTSLADVLMARRNEIDVRLQALQLETETARVWAQLNYLFPDDATASRLTTSIHRNPE
jgi:outer membrane protein TolC